MSGTWSFLTDCGGLFNAIREVAEETYATSAQVSLRLLIEQPRFSCVPIFSDRSVDQLEEYVAVELSLSDDQFGHIVEAYHHK